MSLKDIFEIAQAIIFSLGGGSLIVFSLSSWLGKVWAVRILAEEKAKQVKDLEEFKKELQNSTEKYKVKLKKSEFIFSKQFEATSTLVAIYRDVSPRFIYPDMDYYDACDQIALNFENIERKLHMFLYIHGAVLSEEVKDLICLCIGLAGEYKFHMDSPEVSFSASAAADALFCYLRQAENKMTIQIFDQIET